MRSGVEETCVVCKSSRILLSHKISRVASNAAIYSASEEETVGTDYFLDFQEIALDPRCIKKPIVYLPSVEPLA